MSSNPDSFQRFIFPELPGVLDIVLDHVPQGIVVVGEGYRILAFNRPVEALFKLPSGTFRIGRDFREVIECWAAATGQDEAMRKSALARLDLREGFTFEFSQLVQGELRWMLLTHDPLPEGGFVRTFTDITGQKKLEEQLRVMARTDSLTGLLNRRTFFECFADEFERSRRYRRPLTLLSIDIDHFKQINDTYGHPAGDRVLQEFAQALSACLRQHDHVGRVGGEEFAVLLPETTLAQGIHVAERVLTMAREVPGSDPHLELRVKFTVSIGIAGDLQGSTLEQLVACADEALYRAKREGRDCFKAVPDSRHP